MTTSDRLYTTSSLKAGPVISAAVYLPLLALGLLGGCFSLLIYSYAFGQDLMVFHTAGRLARTGDYATLADGRRVTDLLMLTYKAWLRGPIVLHPWVYPPTMLPFAMAIGAFPFLIVYPALMAASLALLMVCMWRCWPAGSARDLAILLLVLSPGTACCVGAGQVSFIVASIILVGFTILRRRGFVAGLLLSLLTLKPQFALLVPVALVCGGHRTAFIGFIVGAAALMAFSVAMLGLPPWLSWIRFMTGADTHFAAWAQTGRYFGQSIDAYILVLGFSPHIANVGQLVGSLTAAGLLGWTFATIRDERCRLIVFMVAATLGAPHISNYDAILSALAAALVLTTPGESVHRARTILAVLVWSTALLNPPSLMKALGIPVLTMLSATTPLLLLLFAGTMILIRSPETVTMRQGHHVRQCTST